MIAHTPSDAPSNATPPPLPVLAKQKWRVLRIAGFILALMLALGMTYGTRDKQAAGIALLCAFFSLRTIAGWRYTNIFKKKESLLSALRFCYINITAAIFLLIAVGIANNCIETMTIWAFLCFCTVDIPIRLYLSRKKGVISDKQLGIGYAIFAIAFVLLVLLAIILGAFATPKTPDSLNRLKDEFSNQKNANIQALKAGDMSAFDKKNTGTSAF